MVYFALLVNTTHNAGKLPAQQADVSVDLANEVVQEQPLPTRQDPHVHSMLTRATADAFVKQASKTPLTDTLTLLK